MFFMKHKVVVSHVSNGETNKLTFVTEGELQTVRRLVDAVRGVGAERFLEELEDGWETLVRPAIVSGRLEKVGYQDHEGEVTITLSTVGVGTINTEYIEVSVFGADISNVAYDVYDKLVELELPAGEFFQILKHHYNVGTLAYPLEVVLSDGTELTVTNID